jgi:hypothetical protein
MKQPVLIDKHLFGVVGDVPVTGIRVSRDLSVTVTVCRGKQLASSLLDGLPDSDLSAFLFFVLLFLLGLLDLFS